MTSVLNMSDGKMSDFLSFPLFGFTLLIKLRNFGFESHWNTLAYLSKKKKKSQIWIWPVKQGLIWFKLLCSSRISAISWEMQILNFTEIVQYFSIKDSYVKVCPGFFVSFVCFELKMFLMILKYSYWRLLS